MLPLGGPLFMPPCCWPRLDTNPPGALDTPPIAPPGGGGDGGLCFEPQLAGPPPLLERNLLFASSSALFIIGVLARGPIVNAPCTVGMTTTGRKSAAAAAAGMSTVSIVAARLVRGGAHAGQIV